MAQVGRAVGARWTTPQGSTSIDVIELVDAASLDEMHRVRSYNKESAR